MSAIDYAVNIVLVLLVLRQVRERRLDRASLVLPVVLVVAAAAHWLHTIPTAGSDLTLELLGVAVGAAHHITSAAAWTAALVLMALAEVLSRLVVLYVRAARVPRPVLV